MRGMSRIEFEGEDADIESEDFMWPLSYALWSSQGTLNQYRYALLFWVRLSPKNPKPEGASRFLRYPFHTRERENTDARVLDDPSS
jgi:hypothetical protein